LEDTSQHGSDRFGCSKFRRNLALDRHVYPQDVLTTMCRHLGFDTKVAYEDFAGWPHPVLLFGEPIDQPRLLKHPIVRPNI
jgi:hypothetical protein